MSDPLTGKMMMDEIKRLEDEIERLTAASRQPKGYLMCHVCGDEECICPPVDAKHKKRIAHLCGALNHIASLSGADSYAANCAKQALMTIGSAVSGKQKEVE